MFFSWAKNFFVLSPYRYHPVSIKESSGKKINKWDLSKLKSFYTAKEAMNKRKRNARKYLHMMSLTQDYNSI